MRLVFVTEARFIKDREGNVFGDASFNRNLWHRYLNVFSEVNVVARVQTIEDYKEDAEYLSSMEKVNFIELPYFVGPKQYLKEYLKLKLKIKQIVKNYNENHFICRVPGTLSNLMIHELNKINKPYGVEVVGDPWDVFAPGSIKHFLRPYLRVKSTIDLKKNVANASAALYVTHSTLQRRYPARDAKFTTYASNVKINDESVASLPKKNSTKDFYNIISIGSLAQMYKSPDIVLKSIKQLQEEGINCKLTWLGDGAFLENMKVLAKELGIENTVFFKGNVSTEEVRLNLSDSDLFVLASRTEGLPRVLIEAMAAGLPCVATNVGGIPELLNEEVLVPRGSVKELTVKIKEILLNKEFYDRQANRNLAEARNYTETILSKRRTQFYCYLINNL